MLFFDQIEEKRIYKSPRIYKKLMVTDGILLRVYELTKIHKQEHPLRMIVSSIDSSVYPLRLTKLRFYMRPFIKTNQKPLVIKKSYHLVSKLNGKVVEKDNTLISLESLCSRTCQQI